MNRMPLSWSIKQVGTMISKGTIDFNNPIQRPSGQWKVEDKSLLIHSILTMFVPEIFVIKHQREENGKTLNIYDVLDGKQRLTTIQEFKADEFALTELDPVKLDTGETYDISSLKWSELPEEVQDAINGYTLTFKAIELEDGDDEESIVATLFYRLNNGVGVHAFHKALVAAKPNVQQFIYNTLKENPLFTVTAHFPEGSVKKSERQMSIMQSIALAGGYEWSTFGSKDMEKLFAEVDVTEDVLNKVTEAFNMIHKAFPEHNKFVTKINLVSFVSLIINNNFDEKALEFLQSYAKESKKGDAYRRYCGAGATKKGNVQGRVNGIQILYNEYLAALTVTTTH